MNVFDLKKGMKVWGGIMPQGNGFAQGSAMCQELEITHLKFGIDYTDCVFSIGLHKIRLTSGSGMVINRDYLFEEAIYPTSDDFICGENEIEIPKNNVIYDSIMEELGVVIMNGRPQIWVWNEETKQAVVTERFAHVFELSDLKLPEGYYATKYECLEDNHKEVELEITTKHRVMVHEDDVEYFITNPDMIDMDDAEFMGETVTRID